MYSTSLSRTSPTFSSVTVVVTKVSLTPKDVTALTFSEELAIAIHVAPSRSGVDTSATDTGDTPKYEYAPLQMYLRYRFSFSAH